MLRIKAALMAWLVIFAAFTYAQNPKYVVPEQKILGVEKPIKLGKLVKLSVSTIDKPVENLVSTAYKWKVYEYDTKNKLMMQLDDVMPGREPEEVFFGAGIENKQVQALCIITHLYIVKDKDVIKEVGTRTNILSANVIIGEPKPGPLPKPDPDPSPDDPTFVDGMYKLSAFAYKTTVDKVKDDTSRVNGAKALAKSFRGLASSIAAGSFKTLKAALVQSKVVNNQALKDANVTITDWDNFGSALEDNIYELYTNKKMVTPADFGTACLEIAVGLEKVK